MGVLAWLLQAPGWHDGYWPGCYRPQVGLRGTCLAATDWRLAWGYLSGCCSPQGGTGLAATTFRIASGYWPGCYRPQVGLGVLAWLLQAPGWPEGYWPGSMAWGYWPEGYWPGCYRPQVGLEVLAWLLQPTWDTGLGAIALRNAWVYWPRVTGLAATGSKLA